GIVCRVEWLLRPMGPWSPSVHEYLRHLESAGFAGSPRVLGTEGNREVLTFIDGDVAADPHWQPGHGHRLLPYARTGLALRGVAQLIRNLHSAAAGFRPAITSYRFGPRPPQPGEVVSHGDLGPWNTVEADPRSRRHTHDRMAAVGGQGNARHGSGPTGKTPRRKGCATRPAKSWTHYAPQDGGQSCASRTSRSPAQGPSPGGIPLNRPTYNLAQRPPTGGEAERKPPRPRPFGYRPARRPITVIVCRLGRFRRIARCMVATAKVATRRSTHARSGVPAGGEDHRGSGGAWCRRSRVAASAGRGR